jgi:hypothetical protein
MKYVVQQQRGVSRFMDEDADGDGDAAWIDIATVDVPPRTKRKTVIQKALAEAKITPAEDGTAPRLRALDAESAEVHEPEAHQPPMEWKL